ncbi:MAG: aquaporin [Bacillota bacterium]
MTTVARRLVAEGLGTAMLLAVVVGSGMMGERLAGGNAAIALLANATATGTGLAVLILMFGAISGAHFNPAVTLSEAWQKNLPAAAVLPYILAQVAGAFAGVAAAHLMFGEQVFFASEHARTGLAQWWSEFVATFGLVAVIISCAHSRPAVTPFAVALYINSAYLFTSSTNFAKHAVTLARAASNTFAGIRPVDAPGFIVAQLLGATAATAVFCWLYPTARNDATVAGTVARNECADEADHALR